MTKKEECNRDDCKFFHEDKKHLCRITYSPDCRNYVNIEAMSALAWVKRQAQEIARENFKESYGVTECTQIIAAALGRYFKK